MFWGCRYMSKYLSVEKQKVSKNNTQNAQRSIESYISQIKIHFDIDDQEIINILDKILKSIKNNNTPKKWWRFWK